ncbi:PCI domain-containing protein [Fimicolochytrium jonesii]|uniref:PCI domain-containing protein n=1 Tax=Fimicolochytrium jonesii TaxID=1396493 RepID=UPI0022FF35BE|nr:PCI domain-containing protein [Fimicolochytrium jonesii]KAI8816057.1 PCI domain-containing protein [Fimicolochytrium jonesii]
MVAPGKTDRLAEIQALAKTSPKEAIAAYENVLTTTTGNTDQEIQVRETALVKLGELYKDTKAAEKLAQLIRGSPSYLSNTSKAKTAKIIRTLLDVFAEIPDSLPLQVAVCRESIKWAETEKRIFLRQNLEIKLATLYYENGQHADALALTAALLKELKRLDDKNVLMEVQLLESKAHHSLNSLPKSRAALTSARTSANSIYCPPLMQAALDMQSGILHAEEKDFKTAYSYFYETLEIFSGQDDKRAIQALKYMLLCKIMLNLSADVNAIVNSKLALKYAGPEVEAMRAIASAHQNRSLLEFEQCWTKYKNELSNDPIIRHHLEALNDTLFEQNLLRIIEPFSRVEIAHIAQLVQQPSPIVEAKLSQMILDKVFSGILDQGAGCLEVFEDTEADKTFEATLETIKNMGTVVESLYEKVCTDALVLPVRPYRRMSSLTPHLFPSQAAQLT